VSSNLSNASTTAYKTVSTSFYDLVSADDSSTSTGIGVTTSTTSNNTTQGTITSEDVDTYLAISGSGYFVVKTGTVNSDGSTTFGTDDLYSRTGDFTLNAEGYLTNSDGYYLMGWTVDPTTGDVDTDNLTEIQITDLTDAAVATSEVTYEANVPASVDDGTTTSSSTCTIYDSLGTEHTMTYTWTKVSDNTWELSVNVSDGAYDASNDTTSDFTETHTVTFDTSGNIESIDGDSSTSLTYNLSFEGAEDQTITADFSDVTQFAATELSTTGFDQDGVPAGSFESLNIDSDGYVSINYSNGVSKTYYQIPIATFNSANNLESVSGNAYKTTTTSGTATLNVAGEDGAGDLTTSALESSATDIASEFTTMITAQRIYSANAKVITTVDEMSKTLIDI
jgi:flagellar hook protein FlgE